MKLWLRVRTLACFSDWVTLVMICKNPKLIAEGTEVNTKQGMPAGPCLELPLFRICRSMISADDDPLVWCFGKEEDFHA